MKILDNLAAQSTLLALILSVPVLFATGLPGAKDYTFNLSHVAKTDTSRVPESNTPTNADIITVDEPEEREIQNLKDAATPTRLSRVDHGHLGERRPH